MAFGVRGSGTISEFLGLIHSILHSSDCSQFLRHLSLRIIMQHFNSTVARGDIVWARVRFPHQFLPALVLSIDDIGIFVSFFNHRLSLPPRYVIESEVLPFEQSFRWIMDHRHRHCKDVNECDTFFALLDSALKLVGTRVLSSLKCRCLVIPSQTGFDGSNSNRNCCLFQPLGVLGFVKKVAVFPWVDEVDFVDAVRVVAQVHAFRGYCSVEQKGVYQKTQGRGNGMKLLQCSSLGEKMNSVSQDSVTSKLKYESQVPLKEEKNLVLYAGRRLNSRIPVLKGNINSLYKNQLQVTPHTHIRKRKAEFLQEISPHMHSLTFGPFYLWGENLIEYVKHELFRFSKMSGQNIVDSFFEILCKMSKHHHPILCNILTQLSYSFSGSGDMQNLAYFTKKRRRLDHHSLCDSSFKLQKLSSFSTNVASVNKEDGSDVFTSSASAICFSSCDKMENLDSYLTSFLQSSLKIEISNPCSNRILSETSIGSSSCNSIFKDSSCQAGFPLKDRVQETEEKAHVSKYSEAKMLELGRIIHNHDQSSRSFKETSGKLKYDVKQSLAFESTSNFVLDAHSKNHEVNAKVVRIKGFKGSDSKSDLWLNSTLYHRRLRISSSSSSGGGDKTPLISKIRSSTSRGCLMKNENLNKFATHTIINSNVGEQPTTPVSNTCSKFLHIKFPKNFKLPSKSKLIEKFRVFGSVNYLETKVSSITGAAKVAFFQEADALTAYLYAKRKKESFGGANVRFWLDPLGHKRGRSSEYPTRMSPSISEQVPLKSCLKHSSSQEKDNRKKPYKVRFTIVTD